MILAAAFPAVAADLYPAQPTIPNRTFNLADYGATPGGKVPTDLFSKAVAAVDSAGGGTLVVPAGVWFTLPFNLCSNINLHLEAGARILFSPNQSDYKIDTAANKSDHKADSKLHFRPLLLTTGAHDVMISGSGTIDGSGSAWWPEAFRFKAEAAKQHSSNNTSPRPRMVLFDQCTRVRVEGVTLTNSPVFNLVPTRCTDVTVYGITIKNPYLQSPNTDGIDPSVSSRVLISHCTIDTDDDCIAVKAGSGDAVMEDLLITDCTFLHGHGCSIGSETISGLRNMVVQRCTVDGTDAGIRLKSDRKRGGLVENLVYRDLTMKNVGVAISLSSYYVGTTTDTAPGGAPFEVTVSTPRWKGIVIQNVTATACTKSAGLILGLPEMPAEDIVLENVQIQAPKGLKISNAKDIVLKHVKITADEGPAVIADSSVEGLVQSD